MGEFEASGGIANAARTTRVAAGTGKSFEAFRGDLIVLSAPEGPQVIDTWAFALPGRAEFLSTEHTRSCLDRLSPKIGEAFYTNRRRPILTIVDDTSAGYHDLLLSACDLGRYELLGHRGYHRNCVDNFKSALAELGWDILAPPSPVNIFENVSIMPDGTLSIEAPRLRPGDGITLRAEMNLMLIVSACPMDIVPTNGLDQRPKSINVSIRPRNSQIET